MEYTVLRIGTFDGLIAEVNRYIDNGWRPQGGFTVDLPYYYQAMVRD